MPEGAGYHNRGSAAVAAMIGGRDLPPRSGERRFTVAAPADKIDCRIGERGKFRPPRRRDFILAARASRSFDFGRLSPSKLLSDEISDRVLISGAIGYAECS